MTTAAPGIIGHVPPVTDQGISLQVLHANANALGTTIQVALSGVAPNQYRITLDDATRTDNTDQTFPSLLPGAGYSMLDPTHSVGIFEYFPLSPAQLAQPVHLVLTVHHVTIWTNQKPRTVASHKVGVWKLPFAVNPVAGTIYHLPSSTVSNQGIGIQLQTLEVAPPSQTALGQGGIRIMLLMTGLPPHTLLQSFSGWQAALDAITATRGNCPPHTSCSQQADVSAVLQLPGFMVQTQGANGISLPLASQSQTAVQMVGATGTMQLELLYQGQGTPAQGTGTLTISNFKVFLAGSPQPVVAATLPPWQLAIPVNP